MDKIINAIKTVKDNDFYPYAPEVNSAHGPEVLVNGRKMLLFASNNYLGMMTDERVKESAMEGVKKWGIGNGSARLLTGNLDFHHELEQRIAGFKNRESALTFVSGYMVNEGCIPAIANVLDVGVLDVESAKILKKKDTVIFSDALNHASVIAGIKGSEAHKEIYLHNDMADLKNKLEKYPHETRKLIVTDSIFSMDGDIVNLPDLMELARKHRSMVYIDDAHATGVMGRNGRGIEDHFGMEGSADFVMGTFTKCFGGVGGFITSNREAIDYLRIFAKSFMFTAPIAPPVAYGLMKAIEIVQNEPWRRNQLLRNAAYLRESLKALGFDIGHSESQIIPIMIGNEKKVVEVKNYLLKKNIFIPLSMWPAVPRGTARLRVTVMTSHTREQIDCLLETMKEMRDKILHA